MSRELMMKLAACALVIATACAGAVPAGAQGAHGDRSVELSVFNGYYIGSDLYTSTGVGAGSHIGLTNSYMWGGRVGFNPNPGLGVEFVYTRIGSDLTVVNSAPGYAPGGDLGRVNGNCYDMDFLFSEPTPYKKARGYFTLGFGWTVTEPDIKPPSGKSISSNSLFAWNFGLGTKVDLNEKMLLRLEGRWRVTDTAITTSSGVYCDYWGYCYSYASDWYSSGELTAGLTYKLPQR